MGEVYLKETQNKIWIFFSFCLEVVSKKSIEPINSLQNALFILNEESISALMMHTDPILFQTASSIQLLL